MEQEELDDIERTAESFLRHGARMSPNTVLYMVDELRRAQAEPEEIKSSQHCTSEDECDYSFSHTAEYCGREQPRRCGCPFCYPEGE